MGGSILPPSWRRSIDPPDWVSSQARRLDRRCECGTGYGSDRRGISEVFCRTTKDKNMKASKGSEFEREISKKLSLWWTGGKRDDIFWRSSQSGGRATQRAKKGQRTYGSYGDIAAVDPIGEPLLKFFTIELKRGSSHGSPGDLLDFRGDNSRHPWILCLRQAMEANKRARSLEWMLICRRDRRETIVYMTVKCGCRFLILRGLPPRFRLHLKAGGYRFSIFGIPLETFLREVTPQKIIDQL